MNKRRNGDRVEIGMQYARKYNLVRINVGDTVLVDPKAKLHWFAKDTAEEVRGEVTKVKAKGKYTYTVVINGVERFFMRTDLKKVE